MVITRTVFVPTWLLAFAAVVVLTPPATAAAGLLLFGCGFIAAATLLGRNTVHPLLTNPLPTIDVRPLSVTRVGRPAQRPRSSPDSGFRNIGRGTKGG